ncbi:MAG: hypothetical protein ACLFP8_00325 [Alphaproteobacteria bacterium]
MEAISSPGAVQPQAVTKALQPETSPEQMRTSPRTQDESVPASEKNVSPLNTKDLAEFITELKSMKGGEDLPERGSVLDLKA